MYAGSEAEGFNNFVFSAISAAVSMTTAWYTASAAFFPQAKGPWFRTRAPGTASGSYPHGFYNDGTRIFLISAFRFLFRQCPCAGDIPIKIIRMGRTEGRNIKSRLGKSCGIDRMGMCHTADFRKRAVQRQVGLRIGRRFPF